MLKEIAIVTITVSNLSQVESSWKEQFEYRVRDTGTVSAELADYWQADAMEGRDYVIMAPKNNAPVYIRFVEDEAVADRRDGEIGIAVGVDVTHRDAHGIEPFGGVETGR